MKKNIFGLLVVILITLSFLLWERYNDIKALPLVAIVQVVECPALDQNRKGILDQLKEEGFHDQKNVRLLYESAQGNPALATQIAQKFFGLKADVIVAIGTTVAQAATQVSMQSNTKTVPVIFTAVTDPVGAKLANKINNDSYEPNPITTGISDRVSVDKQIAFFKKIMPTLKRIGVIYNPGEANSESIILNLKKLDRTLKVEVIFATASKTSEVVATAQSLVGKVDAIFINNDNTALAAFDGVVRVGKDNKIPVFVSDIECIDQGALAALGPDQYLLGKQTGKMVAKILRKEAKTSDLPLEFPVGVLEKMNKEVAKELGIIFN